LINASRKGLKLKKPAFLRDAAAARPCLRSSPRASGSAQGFEALVSAQSRAIAGLSKEIAGAITAPMEESAPR